MFAWENIKEHPPPETKRYLVTDGVEVDIAWWFADHEMFYDGDGVVVFAPMRRVVGWAELPDPKMEE